MSFAYRKNEYNNKYLSNGPLEGFNNRIKLVKKVSYGYNSFDNFRLLILIMSRLFVSKYKIMKELVSIVKMLSSLMLLSIL